MRITVLVAGLVPLPLGLLRPRLDFRPLPGDPFGALPHSSGWALRRTTSISTGLFMFTRERRLTTYVLPALRLACIS
jgi:hypothetical protein